MNIKKVIQFIALGIILIGFPLGSWIYIKKGFNERKGALDQLKYEIPLPNFQLRTQKGNLLTKSDLAGGYAVLGTVDKFSNDHPVIQHSENFYKEFGDSKKLSIITYLSSYDSLTITRYMEGITKDTLSQWYFLTGESDFEVIFKEHQPNYLALIDTSGVVRNYYNADEEGQAGLMAKHIAMFVTPLMTRGDLVFKRNKEK